MYRLGTHASMIPKLNLNWSGSFGGTFPYIKPPFVGWMSSMAAWFHGSVMDYGSQNTGLQ